MNKFDNDIISGSVFKSVWKIAWPVVITQLVSGIHGIVDQILIGRYVGYEAQAGIGISWQLFLVVLVFLSSLFHGMNIHIARYSGKRDQDAVNRVFFETFKVSLYLLIFMVAPIGYFIAPTLLGWIQATDEVQRHAQPYLRLLFTTSWPLFIMFILNGAFQSTGHPKIPLYFGLMTTVVKIIVSYVLITGLGPIPEMGVIGAGIGTCVGPLPSVIIALYLIARHKVIIGLPKHKSFLPDMSVIKPIARVGVPSGIQAVLLNIGGAVLLYFIGSLAFSAEAQAAYTICYGQLFSCVTWAGFGLRAACATVIGQNIGAGKVERGKRSVYVGALIGALWAALFGFFYLFIPHHLLALFGLTDDSELMVVEIASELLRYLSLSGIFVVVSLAFTGGLQGAGDTKKPMYIAFVSQIIILLGICLVFQMQGTLSTDKVWSAILVSHFFRLVMSYIVFARGNWHDIKVEIGSGDA
jgi:putative MATE family efflux protein